MTLGERIKIVRKTNNLNQIHFAKILGISQTHVSKIEKGIENPSETLLLFMSYKFAVNINWLKNEEGNFYNNNLGCSAESYLEKLIYVRHKLEKKASYMNTDSIWEYVDSITYFENLLDCCNIERLNDAEVIAYYKCISRLLFHLAQLTTFNIDTKKTIPEIKKSIYNDIDNLIESYKKI